MTLNDSKVTEMCGMVRFDFIWMDPEHTAVDYHTLATHVIAARAARTKALVRILCNDATYAKRMLELGVDGLIFPVVNAVAELERAVEITLYPPLGTRGFGPIRATDYGLLDADQYIHGKSLDLIRCV